MSAYGQIPKRMNADEFIAWAAQQPEGAHYELIGGEVFAMAPERVGHGRGKGRVYRRMAAAIEAAGLPCEAFVDGISVRVDADTVYEPDVLVRCGAPLDDETVEVNDPVIVVEVVSRSSRKQDAGVKLEDYFRIPSLRHYLVVGTGKGAVVHHCRDASGVITTTIIRQGGIRLDPPGIVIANLFAEG